MPVPAIELRPRGPVALLDAAINLCAQDAGPWSLGLTGGALVTAAVWNVTEALRRGEGLALPTLLLALAWFARGIFQGAACHYVERLVLDPTPPSTWASLRAALGRAPTLFAAVATAFVLNTVGILATLGLAFILFNAHLAVYGAAMRGVGSPLGLYRTSARLLGKAVGGGLMWIRLAFWAQLLLALNLHMAVGTLIYLGRKLVALDLTFVDRYASIDNPVWLFTLATVTFAITEPLRASVAALLLIDGRVRQEGLDLVAGLEQLPRRQRPGGKPLPSRATHAGAAVLLLLVLALPGLARAEEQVEARALPRISLPQTVARLEQAMAKCGADPELSEPLLGAARQMGERERTPLVRLLGEVEPLVQDEEDCDAALARLESALPHVLAARDALVAERKTAGADAARKAKEILSRPEFAEAPKPEQNPEQKQAGPTPPEEKSWWVRFLEWLRDKLKELSKRDESRRPTGLGGPASGVAAANVVIALLIVLVVAVLGFLLYALRPQRKKSGLALDAVQGDAGGVSASDGQNALSRPPEGWASLADQLAARGEFREAVRSLYLALLSRLHRDGAIDYDPAQSNWEYFRRFRGPREWVPPFRELTTRFDYAYYGNVGVDPDGYRKFRELSAPLLSAAPPPNAPVAPEAGRA